MRKVIAKGHIIVKWVENKKKMISVFLHFKLDREQNYSLFFFMGEWIKNDYSCLKIKKRKTGEKIIV